MKIIAGKFIFRNVERIVFNRIGNGDAEGGRIQPQRAQRETKGREKGGWKSGREGFNRGGNGGGEERRRGERAREKWMESGKGIGEFLLYFEKSLLDGEMWIWQFLV